MFWDISVKVWGWAGISLNFGALGFLKLCLFVTETIRLWKTCVKLYSLGKYILLSGASEREPLGVCSLRYQRNTFEEKQL